MYRAGIRLVSGRFRQLKKWSGNGHHLTEHTPPFIDKAICDRTTSHVVVSSPGEEQCRSLLYCVKGKTATQLYPKATVRLGESKS
jgi:hypothetical protein